MNADFRSIILKKGQRGQKISLGEEAQKSFILYIQAKLEFLFCKKEHMMSTPLKKIKTLLHQIDSLIYVLKHSSPI